MTEHTCEKRVYTGGSFRGHLCNKKAKVKDKGKWLCGLHSPDADARRKEKSDAKYREWDSQQREKRKQSDLIQHKVNCFDELLAALKEVVAIADRKTNEFDRAKAAIDKATRPKDE